MLGLISSQAAGQFAYPPGDLSNLQSYASAGNGGRATLGRVAHDGWWAYLRGAAARCAAGGLSEGRTLMGKVRRTSRPLPAPPVQLGEPCWNANSRLTARGHIGRIMQRGAAS